MDKSILGSRKLRGGLGKLRQVFGSWLRARLRGEERKYTHIHQIRSHQDDWTPCLSIQMSFAQSEIGTQVVRDTLTARDSQTVRNRHTIRQSDSQNETETQTYRETDTDRNTSIRTTAATHQDHTPAAARSPTRHPDSPPRAQRRYPHTHGTSCYRGRGTRVGLPARSGGKKDG